MLDNKIFLFTGTLRTMSREEARQKVEDAGGKFTSSVSKKVDFVVAGEEPGSKYDKSRKMGLKMINEEEFLKMLSTADLDS